MTVATQPHELPIGEWIDIAIVGEKAWVNGERVPLEVLQHFRNVENEGERDEGGLPLGDPDQQLA